MKATRLEDIVKAAILNEIRKSNCKHTFVNAGMLQGKSMVKCIKCNIYVERDK